MTRSFTGSIARDLGILAAMIGFSILLDNLMGALL